MAWTEKYVTAAAAGGGDGSSGTPWTLAEAIAGVTAGTRVNIQAGTYNNTTTALTLSVAGTTTAPIWWRGYKTTIGDKDADTANLGTFASGTEVPAVTFTTVGLTLSGSHNIFSNIDIQGARAGAQLLVSGTCDRLWQVRVANTNANSSAYAVTLQTNQAHSISRCYFKATTTAAKVVSGGVAASFRQCTFEGGGNGFEASSNATILTECLFLSNGGHGALISSTSSTVFVRCTFYSPGTDGIRFSGLPTASCVAVVDCTFSNCGGNGLNNSTGTGTNFVHRIGNLFYASGLADEAGFDDSPAFGSLADSASPFVSAAGGDFTPAATSAGYAPGRTLPGTASTTYRSPGAVQAQAGTSAPATGSVWRVRPIQLGA